MVVSRVDGNYYKYELSVLHQLPITNLTYLYMDVCVLRCTPGHIPRYMGKTNNNNKRCQLWIHCMLCRVCFHRILHQISSLWPLLYYSCLHLAFPLVFYPTSLLPLSYYTISIPYLTSLAIYTYSCMLVLTTWFSMHVYESDLSIHVCLSTYPCTPLGICITTCWGVLTSLDPHVQVSELGLTWIFFYWGPSLLCRAGRPAVAPVLSLLPRVGLRHFL